MALTDKLTAIANAIRAKDGTSGKMTLAEMPSKIAAIQAGGATEPYVEETYSDGVLISATLHGHTAVRDYAFQNCNNLRSVSLPSSITKIGMDAFSGCTVLTLTSLPSSVEGISSRAFSGCYSLALTSIPSSVKRIDYNAFGQCEELTSITFEGTPISIHGGAFNGCTNLTTINVPWAEGAVANAPWGATNATINYNYTGA